MEIAVREPKERSDKASGIWYNIWWNDMEKNFCERNSMPEFAFQSMQDEDTCHHF